MLSKKMHNPYNAINCHDTNTNEATILKHNTINPIVNRISIMHTTPTQNPTHESIAVKCSHLQAVAVTLFTEKKKKEKKAQTEQAAIKVSNKNIT